MTGPRKITKFEICSVHEGWFAGETRRRKAETFCEGGPGMANPRPCDPFHPCRMWAGTDFFVSEVCEGEYQLDWTVNRDDFDVCQFRYPNGDLCGWSEFYHADSPHAFQQ